MTDNELKKALDKLTGELQNIDQSDTESREMLKQLVGLIELKLREPADKERHEGLLDKLKEKTAYFEAKHPLIGSTLEEIIAILVRLGI